MKVEGRSAIVTGGSSGLGGACVAALAEQGCKVIAADLQEPSASLPDGAQFVKADVCDEASFQAAVDAATSAAPLGVLINCAGIAIAARMLGKEEPMALSSFSKVVQVNLVGTFNAIRLAAWAMKECEPDAGGERGAIINTASVAAFEGQIGQIPYSASKGGVVGLTLPAARELSRFGIRVVTIAPGIFDTPMLAGLPEKARQSLGEQVPFPSRLGTPAEYASMAMSIIGNPMLNGCTVRLDGALRMAPR
ncbi:MAG: SDR family NAD(P)-dependent oxidoreductase [Deltaproteobacteria bacterium]|nr:SDR family NAD(P)-dependent oxidoreductase [Deltaproteobacteria bacterium]